MLNLASFHERLRRPGAMTAHSIYRIAFAACVGILILGPAAPGRAGEGLPTSDTPYGAGKGQPTRNTGQPTAGAAPVQIGDQLNPKQCGAIEARDAVLSKRLDEIGKAQAPLYRDLDDKTAQLRKLKCVDVHDLDEPAKYRQCGRIRKERLDALRKLSLGDKEKAKISSERTKMSNFLAECKAREAVQRVREGGPASTAGDSSSPPSNDDRSNLIPTRTRPESDCNILFGWTLTAHILCP